MSQHLRFFGALRALRMTILDKKRALLLSFRTQPHVIPNAPTVIPNGVRNLRSPSDGRFIPLTTQRVSNQLRFFGVRASE